MSLVGTYAQSPNLIYCPGSQVITANGNSGPLHAESVSRLFLSAIITAVGGTPNLVVSLDQQDANGNWITGIASLTALTAAGQAFTSIGPGCAVAQLPTGIVRVVWTVTGGTPSLTGTISLLGR